MRIKDQISISDKDLLHIRIDDKEYWLAKEVCERLTIKNADEAFANLESDEKAILVRTTDSEQLYFVNTSGFINLIFLSHTPLAKKLRRWITHEVLSDLFSPEALYYKRCGINSNKVPEDELDELGLLSRIKSWCEPIEEDSKPESQNLTIEDIPPNLRLAYRRAFKDYPGASLSPGLIRMLQNYACDPADEERWNEINAFMERDLDAEDNAQIQQ